MKGHSTNLTRPFKGPYKIDKIMDTTVVLRDIQKPQKDAIMVHINRCKIAENIPREVWRPSINQQSHHEKIRLALPTDIDENRQVQLQPQPQNQPSTSSFPPITDTPLEQVKMEKRETKTPRYNPRSLNSFLTIIMLIFSLININESANIISNVSKLTMKVKIINGYMQTMFQQGTLEIIASDKMIISIPKFHQFIIVTVTVLDCSKERFSVIFGVSSSVRAILTHYTPHYKTIKLWVDCAENQYEFLIESEKTKITMTNYDNEWQKIV